MGFDSGPLFTSYLSSTPSSQTIFVPGHFYRQDRCHLIRNHRPVWDPDQDFRYLARRLIRPPSPRNKLISESRHLLTKFQGQSRRSLVQGQFQERYREDMAMVPFPNRRDEPRRWDTTRCKKRRKRSKFYWIPSERK